MVHVTYVDDLGVSYRLRQAADEQTHVSNALEGGTPSPSLPKGVKPRRRFYKHPTTGRERSVVICSVAQTAWTEAVGTARAMVDFGGVAGAFPITIATTAYLAQGATGEKRRAI
jgi:hypothetical protein